MSDGPGAGDGISEAGPVVSVVVIDDESLVRSGIAMVLGASPRIAVRAAVASDTAVATVREHAPDVVLLDIRMPAPDGLAILAELMAEPRPPAVAMLTTFDTDDQVLEALHRGASGFLLKDTDPSSSPGTCSRSRPAASCSRPASGPAGSSARSRTTRPGRASPGSGTARRSC